MSNLAIAPNQWHPRSETRFNEGISPGVGGAVSTVIRCTTMAIAILATLTVALTVAFVTASTPYAVLAGSATLATMGLTAYFTGIL